MKWTRRRFLQASFVGVAGLIVGCTRHELPDYVAPRLRQSPPEITDELRLVIVGDWGSGQVEQWEVAQGCEAAAAELGGFHAGIFLGDNFYPAGVDSVGDPLWEEYFEQVYDTEHLGGLTWHAILGNHDHAGNPQAQIDYSRISNGRWNMPDYFYRQDFRPRGGDPLLTMIGIDTDRNLERQHEQLHFLQQEIDALQVARWPVIICGHHPFHSNGNHEISTEMRQQLEPLIRQARPVAYFCGHDHNLQLIRREDTLHVVSGGGGKVLHNMHGHVEGTLYKERAYGFVVMIVRRDGIRLEFRDRRGNLLHTHTANDTPD